MFTRIYKMRAGLALALGTLVLAACQDGGLLGPTAGFDELSPERAVLEAGGRKVAMEPPAGFCIDPGSATSGPEGGFLLLGDCAEIAGVAALGFAPQPRPVSFSPRSAPIHAILSASVGASALLPDLEDGARMDTLEAALHNGLAQSLLGRGGELGATELLATKRQGDTLYVLLEDGADPLVDGAAPRFWRAFTEVNGRMAVLTISAFDAVYAGDAVLLRHLIAFREAVRAANA